MIIYNITWLKNLIIQDQMKKEQQDLQPGELLDILEKHPVPFHSSNLFMRIGLFVVTSILTSFAFGFLSLILSNTQLLESPAYYIFLGLISYTALEIAVREYHHYKSGVDDALLWTAGSLLIMAPYIYIDMKYNLNNVTSGLLISAMISVLGTYFTLRFVDMLMALLTFCAFITFVFFAWYEYGFLPFATMPFLMMIVSATVYFLARDLYKKHWVYQDCLRIIQLASLFITYAAGNYFVVRELGSMMNDVSLSPDQGIPFGWFFWGWTFGIPLVYIGMGLKKKEVILLRSGLILVAIAAFTFRNYYHILPIEMVLVLVGALLLGLSYGIMRYLKTPKHGFTAEELEGDQLLDQLKVESLIVSGTFGDGATAPEGTRMGGGNFGGGGASGNF
ncbi:hypothetical protein QG516_15005 [Pedobacter gandavensis]|uniref:hypothetical protein n=1 Tax=Pedobacter TaxID=84567 RepID=UPI001C9926A6|nr:MULTISPECIES: hypothetical protein [Pedobacter]WGQ07869.1 hypothetical protein QG516_15005 [Pedobacter gandavensis]